MQHFRAGAAAIAWFALGVQYWLLMTGPTGPDPLGRTINFFSYFTILGNILAALTMTLPVLSPASTPGRLFAQPSVRSAVVSYMIVISLVYALLLRSVWNPQGWQLAVDVVLHYVMPLCIVADWLLFVPHGSLRPWDAVTWLAFPVAFAAWTVVHGAFTSFYPYPFFDIGALGVTTAAVNAFGLSVVFAMLGLLLVAADRKLSARRSSHDEGTASPR